MHCPLRQLLGQPQQPDPRQAVSWGDQTWEEMMIGFIDYASVNGKKAP
jgi:hypothetical protein